MSSTGASEDVDGWNTGKAQTPSTSLNSTGSNVKGGMSTRIIINMRTCGGSVHYINRK